MFLLYALSRIIDLYIFIIIIRALISWFSPDPYNPLYQLLIRITEPALEKIRRFLPRMSIDISPFILIIILNVLRNFITGSF